jgi:hypothetical protein
VVTENERLRLPINQNILAASPYLVIHMVHWVQKPARPFVFPAPNIQHQAQCDHGANISVMNNIKVFQNTVDLEHPFLISSDDRTALAMAASIHGTFVLPPLDGFTCDVPMYCCPSLADTIVSPEHFASPAIQDCCYNGYCLIDLPGYCHILLSYSHENDASSIALQKRNDLYFIAGSEPRSSGPRISHLATNPQPMSELWHRHFGHPGQTQLCVLAKHSTGLP